MTERSLFAPLIKGAALDGWALFLVPDAGLKRQTFDIAGCDPSGKAVGVCVRMVPDFPDYEAFPWESMGLQKPWLRQYAAMNAHSIVCIYEAHGNKMSLYQLKESSLGQTIVGEMPVKRLYLIDGAFRGWNDDV